MCTTFASALDCPARGATARAIDHQDQVGLRQQGLRIPTRGERMLGRQREIARTVVDDRNGKGLGELLDGTRRFDGAAAVRRDQQRPLGFSPAILLLPPAYSGSGAGGEAAAIVEFD